jgi:hypothetical protein
VQGFHIHATIQNSTNLRKLRNKKLNSQQKFLTGLFENPGKKGERR